MPPRHARQRRPWTRPAGAVAVIGGVALAVWSLAGPLRPGWASGPKHPSKLLATNPATTSSGQGAAPNARSATNGVPALPFDAILTGALTQSGSDDSGPVTITIDTRVSGAMAGHLTVVLRGQAAGSGVSLASSSVTFGATGALTAYHGQVILLNGDQLVASVVSAAGSRINLGILLQIDPTTGSVKGSLHAGPDVQSQAAPAGDGDADGGR